jgi:hypothetical protein
MVSFPPEMSSPSVNSEEGGMYATALTKAEPCEDMVQSYFGGLGEMSFQMRTVASLDAEATRFGLGKTTSRTCCILVPVFLRVDLDRSDAYIVFMAL